MHIRHDMFKAFLYAQTPADLFKMARLADEIGEEREAVLLSMPLTDEEKELCKGGKKVAAMKAMYDRRPDKSISLADIKWRVDRHMGE